MNKKNEEPLYTCVIPENFVDTGRCFSGMFKTRNLIEGIIASGPFLYIILNTKSLSFSNQIVLSILIAGGIFALFVHGINGDSVVEFLIHFFAYNEKKRITRYNPRVKMEAVPGYLTKNRSELPRDKIIRLIDSIGQKTNSEEAISSDIYNPSNKEFFEDDLGYVETPQSLKSRTELRREAKEKRRKEKEKKKAQKQAEKEKAKMEKEILLKNKKQAKQTLKNTPKKGADKK